jgi:hypothetical protein
MVTSGHTARRTSRSMETPLGGLQYFPRCARRRSLSSVAIALVLLAFGLPSARCQLNSRSPFTGRGAGVMLVATLESLSVGAAPAALSAAAVPGGTATSAPVAVTTRWVVPSHLTTLRLVGYVQANPQAARVSGGPQPATLSSRVSSPTGLGDTGNSASSFPADYGSATALTRVGLPMVTQDAESSFPGTRTDRLSFASGRGLEAGSSGVLSILVQAL